MLLAFDEAAIISATLVSTRGVLDTYLDPSTDKSRDKLLKYRMISSFARRTDNS